MSVRLGNVCAVFEVIEKCPLLLHTRAHEFGREWRMGDDCPRPSQEASRQASHSTLIATGLDDAIEQGQ